MPETKIIDLTNSMPATVQEKVYSKVKKMILDGEVRQGQRIVERQLANKVGSSRVPVREALLRLSSDGFLTNVPHLGFIAREYTLEDAIELYELREAIEGAAARLVVEKANDIAIGNIKRIHVAMSELNDINDDNIDSRFNNHDNRFHHAILSAGGNSRFIQIFKNFHFEHMVISQNQLGITRTIEEMADLRSRVVDVHKRVVDAIVARDGMLAEEMMRRHIQKAKNEILSQIRV